MTTSSKEITSGIQSEDTKSDGGRLGTPRSSKKQTSCTGRHTPITKSSVGLT